VKNLTQPVSVFLSYAHEDERLKDRLVAALAGLEQDGLVNLWHDREIGAGKDWQGAIDDRLNQADLILLLVSPDFLASDFCRTVELARALERSERRQSRVIPVILRSCDWQATALGQFQALPRDGRPVAAQGDESEALAEVAAGVMAAALAIRAEVLPAVWNVPFRRNPHFTGRSELLQSLRSALNSGKPAAVTQAVHGLGGVGKTQLAVEYAYRHASDYNLVWWLRSEDPATLAGDYARLAEPLDLPLKDDKDQGRVVRAVRSWLESNKGWLLIFDHVEQPEDLREYLPQTPHGHVIVTSRNPGWHGIGEALPVGVLTREQAIQLLLRRSGGKESDRDAATKLAEELGDLPLALDQAAAYVGEADATLDYYLGLLQTHRRKVLAREGATQEYPASVATTWEISFQRLEQESPAAAELLNLCGFLAPDAIPLDLIAEGRGQLPEVLCAALSSPATTDELKASLIRYSLAAVKDNDLTLHRLVQAVIRERMSEAQTKRCIEAAARLVDVLFPRDSRDARLWSRCSRLLPHALTAIAHAVANGVMSETAASVCYRAVGYFQGRELVQDAELLLGRAVHRDQAVPDASGDMRTQDRVSAQGEQAASASSVSTANSRLDANAAKSGTFISYRRNKSADPARLIRNELQSRGYEAFLDIEDLGAHYFDDRLLHEIEKVPNFVVILTRGSLKACGDPEDWLRREIAHAIRTGRNIVPVLMDHFKFPKQAELPDELRELPRHNGVTYNRDYFDATIKRLTRFLCTEEELRRRHLGT